MLRDPMIKAGTYLQWPLGKRWGTPWTGYQFITDKQLVAEI